VTISFEIPHDIEQEVAAAGADLNGEAREAFLVELYRRRKISQHQLGMALGVDDYETDEVLKRHGVALEISVEEQRTEADSLGKARAG
jgi:predicted HTH domain antitoxin